MARKYFRPHITRNGTKPETNLREWRPNPDNRVNSTGGEDARGGMTLKTVDDRLVAFEHADDVARLLLPAEELAVVGPRNDVLALAKNQKITLQLTTKPGVDPTKLSFFFVFRFCC